MLLGILTVILIAVLSWFCLEAITVFCKAFFESPKFRLTVIKLSFKLTLVIMLTFASVVAFTTLF